jgi:UDP-N-acetylglucosamine transferase subunit ALG13
MQQIINTLLDPVVNFGKVTVSTGYTNLDTVIVLTAGHGSKLPNPSPDGQFNIVWHNSSKYADASDDPNVEIVRCTVRTGDV